LFKYPLKKRHFWRAGFI